MHDTPLQPPPPGAPTVFQHLLEHHFDLADAESFLERYRIPEHARLGEPGLTGDELAELIRAFEAERQEDDEGR